MSDYIGQVRIIYPSRTMFRVLSKIKSADCYKCVNLSGTEKGKEHTYSIVVTYYCLRIREGHTLAMLFQFRLNIHLRLDRYLINSLLLQSI